MNRIFVSLALLFTTSAMACENDYVREYFTQDGHEYLRVTGYCRGEISYTIHLQGCPCGSGLYEVK